MRPFLLASLFAFIAFSTVKSQDLARLPLAPQSGDSYTVKEDKQFITLGPVLYSNISTSGTTAISSAAGKVDRVVVGIAGAAASSVIIKDGTNAIATLNTTVPITYWLGAAVTTGTLSAVTSSTANITVLYR